ncbi:MAG: hypothetical protein RLZZ338_4151, partial [Cyanobacteriota bacterium]
IGDGGLGFHLTPKTENLTPKTENLTPKI